MTKRLSFSIIKQLCSGVHLLEHSLDLRGKKSLITELRNNCATPQYCVNTLSLHDSLHLNGVLLQCCMPSDKTVDSMEMHIKSIFKTLRGVKHYDSFTGLISLVSIHHSCREFPSSSLAKSPISCVSITVVV